MTDRDITNLEDVKFLVDTFYLLVEEDATIGPVFKEVLGTHWTAHLQKMYAFWQTILLDEVAYTGSPFLVHAKLPIHKVHFDAWLSLWTNTIDAHFTGEKANEAKWRAERMGEMFQYKLDYYRNNPAKPLL